MKIESTTREDRIHKLKDSNRREPKNSGTQPRSFQGKIDDLASEMDMETYSTPRNSCFAKEKFIAHSKPTFSTNG
jgi:hypothetical protein